MNTPARGPEERHARTIAAVTAAATGATIVAMDWVPTPLNRNIVHVDGKQRRQSTFIHGAASSIATAALLRSPRWLHRLIPVWFSLVLASAVANWWVPYISGRYPGEITPEVFTAEYADNIRVLPRRAGRPVVPDLQHTLIHSLTAASVVTSVRVLLTTAPQPTKEIQRGVGKSGV